MATEKRLIDAYQLWKYAWNELQKANERHKDEPDFKAWSSGVAEVIAALAKDMPTVDAVEVVRCKDCKHWADGVAGCTDHVKCCKIGYYMISENGYCVYGERRNDGA